MSIEKTKPFFEKELDNLRLLRLNTLDDITTADAAITAIIAELIRKYDLLSNDIEELKSDYILLYRHSDELIQNSLLQSQAYTQHINLVDKRPKFKKFKDDTL